MPKWLESRIDQVVSAGQAEDTSHSGNSHRVTHGTQRKTGTTINARGGRDARESVSDKTVALDTKHSTQTEDSRVDRLRETSRNATVTQGDERTTRTQAAHQLTDAEAGETSQTQTQVEDEGGTITFSIPLRGGLYNEGSANPPID